MGVGVAEGGRVRVSLPSAGALVSIAMTTLTMAVLTSCRLATSSKSAWSAKGKP